MRNAYFPEIYILNVNNRAFFKPFVLKKKFFSAYFNLIDHTTYIENQDNLVFLIQIRIISSSVSKFEKTKIERAII